MHDIPHTKQSNLEIWKRDDERETSHGLKEKVFEAMLSNMHCLHGPVLSIYSVHINSRAACL